MARGDIFYEGWVEYPPAKGRRDDQRLFHVAARWRREDADAKLAEFVSSQTARGHPPSRFWVEEKRVETDFEIPSLPMPRERYTAEAETLTRPEEWTQVRVHILRDGTEIASFHRNYSLLSTFEPFRQGGRDYALIAPNYTATSVMDLQTGKIIASEKPHTLGFCPVGFYVPDWHDIHDASMIPSSRYWSTDDEWPTGNFGFVWGCVWGDDTSWKVQYLDLSRITEGIIVRDDRFGYVALATEPKAHPKTFIELWNSDGKPSVRFKIELPFDLDTGAAAAESYDPIHHEGADHQTMVWTNGRAAGPKDGD